MKNTYILLVNILFLTLLASCKKGYLDQKPTNIINEEDAYASVDAINGIAVNLYASLRFEQDFATDPQSYDICRFDELYNNSEFGDADGNPGGGYRTYYDYGTIRRINLHIINLNKYNSPNVTPDQKKYFIAEARFMRAMVYFTMVSRMGGVPIITEVYDYPEGDPLQLAKPRNKEYEVYDFIANEVDEIAHDLDVKSVAGYAKNRATIGAALALKCRAMLYAGTIAKNETANTAKNLVLPSGVVGIPASMANGYFQKCIDAFKAIKALGYTLYTKDITAGYDNNFANVFLKKDADNPEVIFVKDYDGVNFQNTFTQRAIPRSLRAVANSGSQLNPTLNIAEKFELTASHLTAPFKTNNNSEVIEEMDATTSDLNYTIYDDIDDIFAGRDPRLFGTILTPGSTFRNTTVKLQAGLAVWTGAGYSFKQVGQIEDAAAASGLYNGIQMTGVDGPHMTSFYCSHTGFLLRKYVDPANGSEAAGKSSIPYIVFRYGEMLLNAAEAAFEMGNTADALEYINEIRERAGGASFKITAGELTRDRIRNERTVELAMEDHRFNDLRRWRIADVIWDGSTANQQAVLYALWPYRIVRPGDPSDGKYIYRRLRLRGTKLSNYKAPIVFTLSMYYPAIPADARSNNPLLENNPNH